MTNISSNNTFLSTTVPTSILIGENSRLHLPNVNKLSCTSSHCFGGTSTASTNYNFTSNFYPRDEKTEVLFFKL